MAAQSTPVGPKAPNAAGQAQPLVDLGAIPDPTSPTNTSAAMSGEAWHWQLWYRDPGSAGGSNFADAVAVSFP